MEVEIATPAGEPRQGSDMVSVLTPEHGRLLKRVVADLLVQADATAVLLTDIGGNVVAQAPERDEPEIQTIAALAAGSFAATRQLALLSGEQTFQSICHEGEATSIYAHCVTEFLLLVVFQKNTTLGLVKLFARKAAQELESTLAAVNRATLSAYQREQFELEDRAEVFATDASNGPSPTPRAAPTSNDPAEP